MSDGTVSEQEQIDATRRGDAYAFEELTNPRRRELHIHCYRMLGTLDDADDALQETLLRAWRHLAGFERRVSFRAWLYRIATNVCLTMLKHRARHNELALSALEPAQGSGVEPVHLQPYPDLLLDDHSLPSSPEAIVERHEDIEIAFVAAIQALPPRQRAAILLRDAIGYPATEVATMLGTSVAAVNSALQRARVTLAQERDAGTMSRAHISPGATVEQDLVERLADAWHAADVPAIVAILTEDALFSMPPEPQYFIGREAIAAFLSAGPARGRLDRFRLIPTRANRQPAVAAYWRDGDDGPFYAHGVIVIACAEVGINSLTRFGEAELFSRFGLPMMVDG